VVRSAAGINATRQRACDAKKASSLPGQSILFGLGSISHSEDLAIRQ
jgi:hypothetical protein